MLPRRFQDALATVLSLLNEDLNRVKKKPYVEQPDRCLPALFHLPQPPHPYRISFASCSEGRDDVIVAEEWWLGHVRRERSIVTALFTGQFK